MQIFNQDQFPSEEHYAIIVFKTEKIHHEGDERSKTNTGHGYPAWTQTINNFDYLTFGKNEDEKIK